MGLPPTTVDVSPRGVVCVILRLAVLMQYRRVTDRQTHPPSHTQAYTDIQTHDYG